MMANLIISEILAERLARLAHRQNKTIETVLIEAVEQLENDPQPNNLVEWLALANQSRAELAKTYGETHYFNTVETLRELRENGEDL